MRAQELVFAGRTLRRSPAFTLTAALTIALGVGASTAIFSVANAVVFRPLPYRDPDRLVVLYGDLDRRGISGLTFSGENFADIRAGSTGVFETLAAVMTGRLVTTTQDGAPEEIRFGRVTPDFFRTLGIPIVLGRDFDERDGQPPPAPPPAPSSGASGARPPAAPTVVILSHEYWQRRYGGARDVLGTTLASRGSTGQEIVGVLSPGFELLLPASDNMEVRPDIWIANRLVYNNANRNGYSLRPVGRLKPGATLAAARSAVESAAAAIRKDFPLYETAGLRVRVEPMHDAVVGAVRPATLALMIGATFLLLIACANVANLLLVRASLRRTELAMRSALGASRWQLVRQLLGEAFLLTALGGAGGVALAWFGLRQLLLIAPANVPRTASVRIDAAVLAFTALTSLAATIVFGFVPAAGAFRLNLTRTLTGTGRTAGGRSGVLRSAVVVAQVALCFVLLIGAGLMFRSFRELQRVELGFEPRGLLTFRLLGKNFEPGPPAARAAYTRQVEERLRAIPGVTGAAGSFPFPLTGGFLTLRWGREEALADNTRYQSADWQLVRPGYFETMGVPLVAGRTFTDADNDPRRNVIVIDDMLAAKAFPNESAVGRRLLIRIRTPEPEWVEVIGVVAHQRAVSLAEPGREQVYLADGFMQYGARNWAVRTSGVPGVDRVLRAELREFDPALLVTEVEPMEAIVRRTQGETRFTLMLIGAFAAVAALLVAVGLYGVLAAAVRQRTSEIGVRVAMGAAPSSILRLVIGQGLRLSAAGIVLGVAAALGLTRLMMSMLVGVGPTDPATFTMTAIVFLLIAAVSCWLPARRAAALDAVAALRES